MSTFQKKFRRELGGWKIPLIYAAATLATCVCRVFVSSSENITHVSPNVLAIMQIRCTEMCRTIRIQARMQPRLKEDRWESFGAFRMLEEIKSMDRVTPFSRVLRARLRYANISPSFAIYHHASFIIVKCRRCRSLGIKFTGAAFPPRKLAASPPRFAAFARVLSSLSPYFLITDESSVKIFILRDGANAVCRRKEKSQKKRKGKESSLTLLFGAISPSNRVSSATLWLAHSSLENCVLIMFLLHSRHRLKSMSHTRVAEVAQSSASCITYLMTAVPLISARSTLHSSQVERP